MSSRHLAAILTLGGFVGSSALGAAGTLHVDLEHRSQRDGPEHAHHAGTDSHSHWHGPSAPGSGHSHANPDGLRQGEANEHEHAPVLAAELQVRLGRGLSRSVSAVTPDAPVSFRPRIEEPPPRPLARAGPDARAAPVSRRSVVLQV